MDIDGVLSAAPTQLTCSRRQREPRQTLESSPWAELSRAGDSAELPGWQQCQRVAAVLEQGLLQDCPAHTSPSCPGKSWRESPLWLSRGPVEKWKTQLCCLGQACEWTISSKLSDSKSGFLFNAIKYPLIYKLHLFANVQCFLQQRTGVDVTHPPMSPLWKENTAQKLLCLRAGMCSLQSPSWPKQMESFQCFYSKSRKDLMAKAEHPDINYSPIEKKSQLKLALEFPVQP